MEYQGTKSVSNRNRIRILECYSYAYQSLFIEEILQDNLSNWISMYASFFYWEDFKDFYK